MMRALLLMIALAPSCIVQAAPVTLGSSPARTDAPCVEYYVDALDASGAPVAGLTAAQVSAVFIDGSMAGLPLQTDGFTPFETTGAPIAYTVLVDISGSMRGAPHERQQAAVDALVETLRPGDLMALVSFGDQVVLQQDFTGNKDNLRGALYALTAQDQQTVLYQAIDLALRINRRGGDFPQRRAVIVMSDGKDEGSGLTLDDLAPLLQDQSPPIFAFGYTRIDPVYLNSLNRLSGVTGGAYARIMRPEDFVGAYSAMRDRILGAYVLRLCCPDEVPRGLHELRLTLEYEDRTLVDALVVRVTWDPVSEENEEDTAPGLASVITDEEEAALDPIVVSDPPGAASPSRGAALLTLLATRTAILAATVIVCCLLGLLVTLRIRRRWRASQAETGLEARMLSDLPPIPTDPPPAHDWRRDAAPVNTSVAPQTDMLELCLAAISGPDEGKRFHIRVGLKPVTVGRNAHNDVSLNDELASGHHCELHYDGERLYVTDRQSRNGVKINRAPIEYRGVLENGDTFSAGDTDLRVTL